MKKILLFLVALVATLSMNAQTTEIYKGDTKEATYSGADVRVEFGTSDSGRQIKVYQGADLKGTYTGSDYKVVSKELPPVSVTFVNPEGDVISTMPATQSIQKGSKASKPSDPTDNSGFHTLEGWYKTKDATTGELSDPWDFSNDVVTEDITLYAQWRTTIGKIIGKAAKPFPFDDKILEDVSNPQYKKDYKTWINGNDKIFYGAKYLTGDESIFVRRTLENGGTKNTQTYYYRNCLKTGSAYRYVSGTNGIFTFYIENGVFTKMIYTGLSDWGKNFDGTYTPPTPTTGTAKRTGDIDVNWVQLWKGGPKFAEYNVGVTDGKAESYGGYYCWGNTVDQDSKGAYKGGTSALTGTDDTATNLWGSNWRMPTKDEFDALLINCTCTWIEDYNGTSVKGLLCKGKENTDYASNSVFLPAAGCYFNGSVSSQGVYGDYWSSTPDGNYSACDLYFNSGNQSVSDDNRSFGDSVRAVLNEPK